MLDPQMKRGILDICVLSVLCRGDSYGYRIIKDLARCVEVSESTLYPILRRLEASDCLETYSVVHNGRLRKFYSVTEAGHEQVHVFLESWPELAAMHDFIKESVDGEGA